MQQPLQQALRYAHSVVLIANSTLQARYHSLPAILLQVKHYLEGAFGVEGFRQLEQTLCQPPVSTCIRVNTLRTTVQASAPDPPATPSPGATHVANIQHAGMSSCCWLPPSMVAYFFIFDMLNVPARQQCPCVDVAHKELL
jgi:hypothetical protein